MPGARFNSEIHWFSAHFHLGDGLGRDKNGITKPVKANYKFDHAGLGHNPADDMNNHWWENVYNQAATNLNVQTNESNEVLVGLNQAKSVEVIFILQMFEWQISITICV